MTLTPPTAPWQVGVLQQVEDLGRWFSGRVAATAEPSDELVTGRDLRDPYLLSSAIVRTVSVTMDRPPPGTDKSADEAGNAAGLELRVAASRFARHYAASLTAVALVGLGCGVGLDLSADRCTFAVRHNMPWTLLLDRVRDDVLQCAERPSPWSVSGPSVETLEELREYVWRKLYAENLWPVLQLLIEIVKINPGVVWTNAAEWPALVGDSAVEYLAAEVAEPFATEANALLAAPRLPGLPAEVNPLGGRFEWLPGDGNGFPDTVQTRKACCLTYLLADRFGRLCQSCPYLPLADRIALVRERHGVPMGAAGGPAQQRSIERGLARPSTRHVLGKKQL